MRHGRQTETKHRGYTGPRATPWKYRLRNGSLIRRGWPYRVRLVKALDATTKVVLWEGEVLG